jgi:predicted RND superfamily exporter protein
MLTPLINLSMFSSVGAIFVYAFAVMFVPSVLWLSRTSASVAKWSLLSLALLLVIRFFTPRRVR